jgi:hypothetical protein
VAMVPSPVHTFSTMAVYFSYQPWHDKAHGCLPPKPSIPSHKAPRFLPWDPLALVIVHAPTGMLIFEQVMYRAANACGLADMIEIARYLRDEAAQLLDARFDEALAQAFTPSSQDRLAAISISAAPAGTCCTPTPSGQACC